VKQRFDRVNHKVIQKILTLAQWCVVIASVCVACHGPGRVSRASAPRDVVRLQPDAVSCARAESQTATDAGVVFSEQDWRRIRRMSPVPPLPPDPTNRYADEPQAAAFGRVLFHDDSLSRDGHTACSSCHAAPHGYADTRAIAEVGDPPRRGRRNVMSLLGSAHKRWQTWDGSADSLWAQPTLAFENPREHNLTREGLARMIAARHRATYETLFGSMPAHITEGESADRVVANISKAIAAYERTLSASNAPFDRWVAGDVHAMPPAAVQGLSVFLRVGCIRCHSGAMFSDGDFHTARFPDDVQAGVDRGAMEGLRRAKASVFYGRGRYSDAPNEPFPIADVTEEMRGRFVTPTLRGVAQTAPYGHAGTLQTLEDVIRLYARGGLAVGDSRTQGGEDPFLVSFEISDGEIQALSAFLRALTSDVH
jgi:cytochrome c peroxidase